MIKTIAIVAAGLLFSSEGVSAQSSSGTVRQSQAHESAARFQIPKAMKIEHEELHADLARLIQLGGRTGDAAKVVEKVLHGHFVKEEEYALPPLGLLVPLSQGKFEADMAEVLKMTDKLEAEMPTMLSEHKDIVAALTRLTEAAKAEDKPEGVHFAEKLTVHALAEEEITYPTALLIGRYVKNRLSR